MVPTDHDGRNIMGGAMVSYATDGSRRGQCCKEEEMGIHGSGICRTGSFRSTVPSAKDRTQGHRESSQTTPAAIEEG